MGMIKFDIILGLHLMVPTLLTILVAAIEDRNAFWSRYNEFQNSEKPTSGINGTRR